MIFNRLIDILILVYAQLLIGLGFTFKINKKYKTITISLRLKKKKKVKIKLGNALKDYTILLISIFLLRLSIMTWISAKLGITGIVRSLVELFKVSTGCS